ncbi:hypothetical protein [Bradyrhizobium sp. LA2.1]|uniref:hypothetical protein n=1 Tax=Bradyrhizobium sp. LA2.1 TaxID=3156376 RepID=UPI0033933E43
MAPEDKIIASLGRPAHDLRVSIELVHNIRHRTVAAAETVITSAGSVEHRNSIANGEVLGTQQRRKVVPALRMAGHCGAGVPVKRHRGAALVYESIVATLGKAGDVTAGIAIEGL